MIHYDLRCDSGHDFDGWFRDSAAFAKQSEAGLLACPACGGARVTKRLMAPAVARSPGLKGRPDRDAAETLPAVAKAVPPPAPPERTAGGPMPAQLVAMLQRVRAEIESRCDDVGPAFADEARRIHRGEPRPGQSEARGIYGQTTEAEAEALRDEGIEVARIPWVPRADG